MHGVSNRFTTSFCRGNGPASLLLVTAIALVCGGAGRIQCSSSLPPDEGIAGCTAELSLLEQQATAGGGNPAARQAVIALDLRARADAYRKKGDKERASADYDRAVVATDEAIRLNMGNAEVVAFLFANRSTAHHGMEDYGAAISDLDQAVGYAPKNELYYYFRGDEYAAMADYDRAISDFNDAIRIDARAGGAHSLIHRGAAYVEKGDYDHAIADETQAIQMSTRNVEPILVRGAAYRGKGDYEHAIIDLSAALRNVPNSPEVPGRLVERAHAYAGAGRYAEAMRDYDAALRASPQNAEALYGRGVAKRKAGDESGAVTDITAAQAIDPNVSDDVTKSGIIRLVFQR